MSALIARCICIRSKCRTLYRTCILELLSLGQVVQNRHIFTALSDENTVFIIYLHIRPRHESFLAGKIDNQIRALRDHDIELEVIAFNVAHIKYLHLLRSERQNIKIVVSSLDSPAVVIVLVDLQCCIRYLCGKITAALSEK